MGTGRARQLMALKMKLFAKTISVLAITAVLLSAGLLALGKRGNDAAVPAAGQNSNSEEVYGLSATGNNPESLSETEDSGSGVVKDPWLNGYSYRVPITVSNSGSTLTDYQIQISIDTSTLVSNSKLQSDCDDLRFTTADGYTLMDYWIESGCNSSATVIWTEVPSIASGTSTVYIYYGNASSTAASSGANTFRLFDDFNDASIDTNKWVSGFYASRCSVAEASGYVRLYCSAYNAKLYSYISSKNSYTYPMKILYFVRLQADNIHGTSGTGSATGCTYDTCSMVAGESMRTNTTYGIPGFYVGSTNVNAQIMTANTWERHIMSLKSTASNLSMVGTNYSNSGTLSTSGDYLKFQIRKWFATYSATYDYDYVALCNYDSTEPTTSVGSEVQLITQAGTGAADWTWKAPAAGDYIKTGSAADWSWVEWHDDATGVTVPYNSAADWSWYPQ
jgi:hypothetical protein